MLSDKDIKTISNSLFANIKKELIAKHDLITIVSTKEDMVNLREDVDGLRENVQALIVAVDGLVKGVNNLKD